MLSSSYLIFLPIGKDIDRRHSGRVVFMRGIDVRKAIKDIGQNRQKPNTRPIRAESH
jgi:hypothetical protein